MFSPNEARQTYRSMIVAAILAVSSILGILLLAGAVLFWWVSTWR